MKDKKTEYHNTQSGNYKVETHEPVPEENIQVDDIADMLIILTKQTIDNFLQSGHFAELLALYTFYYYTAKWQKSNQIKCTTSYASSGIGWGRDKVKKYKKMLKEYGLITDVQRRDKETNKITGWYIRINYIFKKTTLDNHSPCLPSAGNSHQVAKSATNALSAINKNALSAINKNIYTPSKTEKKDYAVAVKMTKNQYDKLIEKHGQKTIEEAIRKLSIYKQQFQKKYKCDASALRAWAINAVIEEEKKRRGSAPNYKTGANPWE